MIQTYQTLRERSIQDEGYLRIRIGLTNNHILDVAEYFEMRSGKVETVDYRYHWMDASNQLRCRWDNTPHHPTLANFHIHQGDEDNVLPGAAMNLLEFLDLIRVDI